MRFPDQETESGKDQSGSSRHKKRRLPAVMMGYRPADDVAQGDSHRESQHKYGERAGALQRAKEVSDQRTGCGSAGRFADSHPQPHRKERPESAAKPRGIGERAPQGQSDGKELPATPSIRGTTQWNAYGGVQKGEGGA